MFAVQSMLLQHRHACLATDAAGAEQAHDAGVAIRRHMEGASKGTSYKLFFYTSPYLRSLQTYEGIR